MALMKNEIDPTCIIFHPRIIGTWMYQVPTNACVFSVFGLSWGENKGSIMAWHNNCYNAEQLMTSSECVK